jgi:DNA ligase (NAD+)
MTKKITKEQADKAYREGNPIISDSQYDEMFGLNASDIDTEIEDNSVWPQVKLSIFMGSLLKIKNNVDELNEWALKYGSDFILWSDKLDGSSGELTYQDGKLIQGATRGGNGEVGNNITPNVLKMNVPKTIKRKGRVVVRCEYILHISDWQKHFSDKKNPRNAATGAVNKLDGTNCEHLRCIAFDIIDENKEYTSKFDKFNDLKELGFEMPNYGKVKRSELKEVVLKATQDRNSLPYEVDGIVFDADDLVHFEKLGIVSNRPRAARAFKFADQASETIIKDIVWQVGKTGVITPVGLLEPTELAGVTVSRVILNNPALIAKMGLGPGCRAELVRANDVIPKIRALIENKSGPFEIPRICPSCGSATKLVDRKNEITLDDRDITEINKEITDSKAQLFCPNSKECPSQSLGKFIGFLKALGVKGMASSTIEKLLDAKLIETPADLYTVDREKFSTLEKMSSKVVDKLMKELELKSKSVALPQFIKSLSINGFGSSSTKKAMTVYPTLKDLRGATVEELSKVDGIAEITANCLIEGLKDNEKLIDELLKFVTITEVVSDGKLSGKTFCFTGFRDAESQEKLVSLGAEIKSSVTKDLSYLVVKDVNGTSSKITKAKKNGTEIIAIEEMKKML